LDWSNLQTFPGASSPGCIYLAHLAGGFNPGKPGFPFGGPVFFTQNSHYLITKKSKKLKIIFLKFCNYIPDNKLNAENKFENKRENA